MSIAARVSVERRRDWRGVRARERRGEEVEGAARRVRRVCGDWLVMERGQAWEMGSGEICATYGKERGAEE